MDLSTVTALFNIVVGLMLVASILLMVGGLMQWYVRLGTTNTYRDDSIVILQWAVSILFVLVVLLGIAQFVETHMTLAMTILGAVVILAVAYFVVTTLMANSEGEEEHH